MRKASGCGEEAVGRAEGGVDEEMAEVVRVGGVVE
jgi:hypothetical protein